MMTFGNTAIISQYWQSNTLVGTLKFRWVFERCCSMLKHLTFHGFLPINLNLLKVPKQVFLLKYSQNIYFKNFSN